MAENQCKTCGKPFSGRPNKVYCSVQCRRQAEFDRRVEKSRERLLAAGWDLSKLPEWDLPLLDNPDWPEFDPNDWPGWDEPLIDASGWPPLTDWPD